MKSEKYRDVKILLFGILSLSKFALAKWPFHEPLSKTYLSELDALWYTALLVVNHLAVQTLLR